MPTLPLGNYRFRADKNGQQYFSGPTDHCSIPGCITATITLPVTSGFMGGVKVLAALPRWSTSLSPNLSAGLQQSGTITTTVIRYTYDPLGRLTGADYSTGESFAYAYDAVGNRTAQTATITSTQVANYVYDAANRLASVNGQAYAWSDNDNLLSDGGTRYAYDQANRLISVTLGLTTTQYAYNADGARLKQIVNSAVTLYTQDLAAPLPVVLQSKAGPNVTRYVYALGTRPLAQSATGWEYLLADALGSVRQIADASGNVGLTESYEPYGKLLNSTGTASSIFAYAGEQADTTGLIYLRARYMQPGLGMFLSRDPWSGDQLRPESMNGWNYGSDNPIRYDDPSGLLTEDEVHRPGGADDIVDELKTTYNVLVVKDWYKAQLYPGLEGGQCETWIPGAWGSLRELERVKVGVMRIAKGLGNGVSNPGKIQSALGGPLTIIRVNGGTYAPPGMLSSVIGADIAIGDGIAGDENYATSLVPHEFGHVWDYRTDNLLSKRLMVALGTWVCNKTTTGICIWDPFAKHFDLVSMSWVYPEVAPGSDLKCTANDPSCNKTAYANTYGGSPLFTGPGAEDWAMSFEATVSPESLRDYFHQTLLVPGGVREGYVRQQINTIP